MTAESAEVSDSEIMYYGNTGFPDILGHVKVVGWELII
jgi:hypothetical protein